MSNRRHLITSESVTEGHPDKLCDQIADAILDEMIRKEPPESLNNLRCACEVTATTGIITVMGETRNESYVDVAQVARDVILDVGYDSSDVFFDGHTCAVANYLHSQSPDIALGVDKASEAKAGAEDEYDAQGAGDQGIIYGYACNETKTLMPMPIYLAHKLSEKLTEVRKNGEIAYLRPDGKTQVTVVYQDDKPVAVDTILISTQHAPEATHEWLEEQLLTHVITPVMDAAGIDWNGTKLYTNPTGNFVVGGPHSDTGLTNRKIVVDTYGGIGRVGGGGLSGKDGSKVDRSAAYAARYVAKNVVAAGLAEKCEIQISYAIGVARPLSVFVDTFGTSIVDEEVIEKAVNEVFDLRPAAIIHDLDLRRPIYRKTSNYGHFGRELDEFTWEKTDRVNALKECIEKLTQSAE